MDATLLAGRGDFIFKTKLMPKVEKIRIKINSLSHQLFDVWYTKKEQFHLRDLPKDFTTLTGFTNSFPSFQRLSDSLHSSNKIYKEKKSTKEFVIIYSMAASHKLLMIEVGDGHFKGHKEGLRGIQTFRGIDAPKIAMGFSFGVYAKVGHGDNIEFFPCNLDTSNMSTFSYRRNRYEKVIDYTPERVKFFVDLQETFQNIVNLMANQFFNKTTEEAIKVISNTPKLLV